MNLVQFIVRACIYILAFAVTWFAMDAVNYEKLLKKGHGSASCSPLFQSLELLLSLLRNWPLEIRLPGGQVQSLSFCSALVFSF